MSRFPELRFDVVTLFQVLEHLDDPNKIITDIKGLLTEGGGGGHSGAAQGQVAGLYGRV